MKMKERLTMFLTCLFLSVGMSFAQSSVKGVVVDETDQPVIGASVMLKGTKAGTITDADGNFVLSNAEGKTIEISYLGYETLSVKARNGMRVQLKPGEQMIGEVVVTGMQRMDKRLFTGATSKVDADAAKLNGVADISRSLEGHVAGVSVQNVSGTFGTAPKLRVRGATSIYGSSKPLWVVDGVIMEDVADVSADALSSGDANTLIASAIAGLNSDDIESFQILKDGSATSIYGARAMAGVIVVTTKKGTAGQTNISYTGEYTMRLKPSYSTFNIMNSQDQMAVYQELAQKGWLNYAEVSNADEYGVYGKMYDLISTYDATTGQFGLANTSAAKAAYLRSAEYRNTNWFDELFNNSIQHSHSVSVSSGTEKAQYYASLSAMIDPGWYKQSKAQRYTANLNSTYHLSNKLAVNMIANASFRRQNAPGTTSRSTDAVSGEVKRDFDINPYSYALNTSRTLDPNEYYRMNYAAFNIFNELENNYMEIGVNEFRGQMKLDYKPFSKLELSALGAVKYATTTQEHHITENSNMANAYRAMDNTTIRDNNPFLYSDPDNPTEYPVSVLPQGGIYQRTDNKMFGWDFRATAQYNDVYNEDHIVNLFAGMEANSIDRRETWFRGWGMQYDFGEIANYDYRIFKKGVEEGTEYYTLDNTHTRSAAFFGNGTYSYKGRYTLNGTLRYEGTNGLGKATSARWMPTWNVSGAWNAHEESWFENAFKNKLSHFTLRLSYSLTGDRPAVSNALAIIRAENVWRPSAAVTESALYQSQAGNGELTYEKKHEFNLGFDAGFFDNRINLTFDWYTRRNYDLIGPISTQGTSGDVVRYGNVADMKSSGVELSLTTNNIKTKDFSWQTSFIYSHATNEITRLLSRTNLIDFVTGDGYGKEGYPVRGLFSIPFMGLNSEGVPTFLDQDGNISSTGIYFQTSDPEKLNFLKYEGPQDPTDFGSFGNIFKYKGWTLNVFITYSFGNVVRLDPVFNYKYSDLSALTKEFANRWMLSGDENYTNIPVICSKQQYENNSDIRYAYNAYNYSDARIAKGDFIRMKEISLGYDFPKKLIAPLNLKTLALKLQATNLFLIYADKKLNGQDPEFYNTGGVASPMPKQFTLTLKIGL